jgi:hypothetical protein
MDLINCVHLYVHKFICSCFKKFSATILTSVLAILTGFVVLLSLSWIVTR